MKFFSTIRKDDNQTLGFALVVFCILLLAVFRVLRAGLLPELPNFSPVAAVAFCGGLFLPGLLAWIVPIAVLLISDIALAVLMGYPAFGPAQFTSWACILAVVGIGRLISKSSFTTPRFFSALIASGLIFYVATNTAAWIGNPAYPKSLGGLWMSLTTGLPGFPPSWTFYRNSLISDILFGSIILAVCGFARCPMRKNHQLHSAL